MTRRYQIVVNGRNYNVDNAVKIGTQVSFSIDGEAFRVSVGAQRDGAINDHRVQQTASSSAANSDQIVSPMPGIVVSVAVKTGDTVTRGQTVCVIEAMKMENNITSPRDGIVNLVDIAIGQEVGNRQVLVRLEAS